MLDLEKLFKKRPFIYLINGDYYAMGCGVCSLCNKYGKYVTLPKRYKNYLAIKNEKVSSEDAWDIYRKLVSIADRVKDMEDPGDLEKKFQELEFDKESCIELEKQISDMVDFFQRNRLTDYYKIKS